METSPFPAFPGTPSTSAEREFRSQKGIAPTPVLMKEVVKDASPVFESGRYVFMFSPLFLCNSIYTAVS